MNFKMDENRPINETNIRAAGYNVGGERKEEWEVGCGQSAEASLESLKKDIEIEEMEIVYEETREEISQAEKPEMRELVDLDSQEEEEEEKEEPVVVEMEEERVLREIENTEEMEMDQEEAEDTRTEESERPAITTMKKGRVSQAERDFIKENWKTMTISEMAIELNRSPSFVSNYTPNYCEEVATNE